MDDFEQRQAEHLRRIKRSSRLASVSSIAGIAVVLVTFAITMVVLNQREDDLTQSKAIVQELDSTSQQFVEKRQSVNAYLDSIQALLDKQEYEQAQELTKNVRDTVLKDARETRVYIHSPLGEETPAIRRLIQELNRNELKVFEVEYLVKFNSDTSQIRYFFSLDEKPAIRALRIVKGIPPFASATLIDMRDRREYTSKTRPGLIEIWLAADAQSRQMSRSTDSE